MSATPPPQIDRHDAASRRSRRGCDGACKAAGVAEAELRRGIQIRDEAVGKLRQGLCVFDGNQRLLLFNRRYAEMYDLSPGSLRLGMTLRDVVDLRYAAGTGPQMPKEEYAVWRDQIQVSDRVVETVVELRNGAVHEIHHEPTPGGGWVATFDDITERRRSERRIQHMAHHDALTGLPNRVLFAERLEQMVDRLRRSDDLVAVLCLDLDHFKEINDTLGHSAGDGLLCQVVERIGGHLRAADTLARLGGDEFAIILNDIKAPEEAATFAARVIRVLTAPFVLEGQEAVIGASIGIALCSRDDDRLDPDHLLRCADLALYRAKAEGRATYRFFQLSMDTRLQRRKAMERDLRQALAEGHLEVHYQPQLDLGSGRITGAEALLRWRHPEQGMISPGEFIPLAEDTGLIVPIGAWVLHAACVQAAGWYGVKLAVNLSPVQIRKPGLAACLADVLRDSGLPPERLELEITEGTLLQDTTATLAMLDEIRRLGISIALDDFGTGYSSLSYLRRFPFNKLKIDRSFVANVAQDSGAAAIVQAVTTLGRSLGMRVNAEGVETDEQLRTLRTMGCDEAQGYLLGYPMPPDQFRQAVAGNADACAPALA